MTVAETAQKETQLNQIRSDYVAGISDLHRPSTLTPSEL